MFATPATPEVEILAAIATAFQTNPDADPSKIHIQLGESANFEEYKKELLEGKIVYLMQGPIIDPDEPIMRDTRGAYISGSYFAWVCGNHEKTLVKANAEWHKLLFQTEDTPAGTPGLGRRAHYPVDFPNSDSGSVRFMKYEMIGGLKAKAQESEGGSFYAIEQLIEFTALKIT